MEKNIKHVGQTSYMPGTEGFTIVVFNANDVPVNSHVYMVDNVRLASAAPELLGALEELLCAWESQMRNYETLPVVQHAIKAINKAKGNV